MNSNLFFTNLFNFKRNIDTPYPRVAWITPLFEIVCSVQAESP